MSTKTTPFPFQKTDIRRIEWDFGGRCLLASELGTGKTFVSLSWADQYLPTDPPGPVLVITPAHLKQHWRRECEKHLGQRAEVVYGQTVPKDKLPPLDLNKIFVVNYDILTPPNWGKGTDLPADSWASWFLALKPRLMIVDEAHAVKAVSSARTRAVRKLARKCPRVLLLTGTPLTNKPQDLWTLLNILSPKEWGSRFDFLQNHCNTRKRWWGWEYKGAKNLDLLHNRLQSVMIRRRKCDVLEQLPPIQHSVIPIEVDLRKYNKAETDFVGWLEAENPGKTRSALKAEELSKMNELKRLAGRLKVDAVVDWVEGFLEETDGKLLLGAIHYAVTEPLMKAFGKKAVLVDGRISDKEKVVYFDQFNADSHCRILVGNLQAAGTGWSCRSTSDVAVCELPWVPSDLTQFAGRCHGIGRGVAGNNTHIRYLYAQGTIEEDLCRILEMKTGWASTAIDGIDSSDELPIHDLVRQAIKKRGKQK